MTRNPEQDSLAATHPAIPPVAFIDAEVEAGRMARAADLSIVRLVGVALLTFAEAGRPLTPITGDLDGKVVARALREARQTLQAIGDDRTDALVSATEALESVLQFMALEARAVLKELSPEDRAGALMLAAGSLGQASALLWGIRLDLFRDPGASAKIRSEAGKASGDARRARWWDEGAEMAVEVATQHPERGVSHIAESVWKRMAGKAYRPATPKGVRKALDQMARDGDLVWPPGSRPALHREK